MSYPRDLNEYTETELAAELVRRHEAWAAGLCDYCGRPPTEPPCRFPERHNRRERNCYTCRHVNGMHCARAFDPELADAISDYADDAGCATNDARMPTDRVMVCPGWEGKP